MTELLLGLDVGTSSCKAAVVDVEGHERSQGRSATPWREVPTGAEVDPDALVEAAAEAAREALARGPEGRVTGLGVTSMAETGIALGRDGEPLGSAIAWHDSRGAEHAERLAAEIGAERFTDLTGLPPSPLATIAKLGWLREHRPETRAAVRWLSVAEWVVHRLGGEQMAELSLASRTGFLDIRRGGWAAELLEWAGLPERFLPEPLAAASPAGRVTARLHEAEGAVLAVAGHDHVCAAAGAGAVRPGDVFDSCGTAEAFVRGLEAEPSAEQIARAVAGGVTVGRHVLADRWALLAGFESGLVIRRAPAGPERSETIRAVAARGAAVLATVESVAGATRRIVVAGGGARHADFLAAKREAIGEFEQPPVEEAGARGAALAAGVAAGLYPSLAELPALGRPEVVV